MVTAPHPLSAQSAPQSSQATHVPNRGRALHTDAEGVQEGDTVLMGMLSALLRSSDSWPIYHVVIQIGRAHV